MKSESFSVSRILHAGYIFEKDGCRIAFDPIFENPFSHNCFAFPEVQFDEIKIRELQFDAVFISHVHDDHLCLKSLNRLPRSTPIYLYAQDEIYFSMLNELGFQNVSGLFVDKSVRVGEHITVTPRLALDPQVDSIFQIQIGHFNILNVVDSWIDPQALEALASVEQWDLVLWPFQTMRELQVICPVRAERKKEIPEEWAEVLQRLNPKAVVPSSCQFIHEPWSWYNRALFPISYAEFEAWLRGVLPRARYLRMDPGVSALISKFDVSAGAPLNFIVRNNLSIVDYRYDENYVVPSTGEIAEQLTSLSADELLDLKTFCTGELPRLLIDKGDELLIGQWHFAVALSRNETWEFYFDSGVPVNRFAKPVWRTEIPARKLYSALKNGESLTSLYLRVVDSGDIDILEDPLIRILFDGKAHRYHEQQLRDIQEGRKVFK